MYCDACGTENAPGATFCSECGTTVAGKASGLALATARNLDRAGGTAPILADSGHRLTDTGRPEDDCELLVEARALFERMGSAAWLDAIQAGRSTPAPTPTSA